MSGGSQKKSNRRPASYKPDSVRPGERGPRRPGQPFIFAAYPNCGGGRRAGARLRELHSSYVALHRRGLPCPRRLPGTAVGSYPTLSSLPWRPKPPGRSGFCGTFRSRALATRDPRLRGASLPAGVRTFLPKPWPGAAVRCMPPVATLFYFPRCSVRYNTRAQVSQVTSRSAFMMSDNTFTGN